MKVIAQKTIKFNANLAGMTHLLYLGQRMDIFIYIMSFK